RIGRRRTAWPRLPPHPTRQYVPTNARGGRWPRLTSPRAPHRMRRRVHRGTLGSCPMTSAVTRAIAWGLGTTTLLAILIVAGSRELAHFAAALVAYTFAVLFATFGLTYRYAMWLQRPPTGVYWRRGWQAFFRRGWRLRNLGVWFRRFGSQVLANRFIFERDRLRGLTHLLIMWGCIIAVLITFPLVFGWLYFI